MVRELLAPDTGLAFEAMRALRTHYTDRDAWVERVDDLSTLPAGRGKGHGEALLRWIFDEAQRLGCDEVHLDSGTVPERWAAHRLYHRVGMNIYSHHFTIRVD